MWGLRERQTRTRSHASTSGSEMCRRPACPGKMFQTLRAGAGMVAALVFSPVGCTQSSAPASGTFLPRVSTPSSRNQTLKEVCVVTQGVQDAKWSVLHPANSLCWWWCLQEQIAFLAGRFWNKPRVVEWRLKKYFGGLFWV